MAAVSQATLSNAFFLIKMLEFLLRFHWSLFLMPRSHQTRSQYVLQNVAERGQTVGERNECCDNCLESFYELNGRFMDAVDGLEWEGHSRTSRLLKILRRPSHSEIGRSDNVLKTRWTFYERNCRTSDLLGTHYNVVQSSISYSMSVRRPSAFLLSLGNTPRAPLCSRSALDSVAETQRTVPLTHVAGACFERRRSTQRLLNSVQ